jgi:RNA polymerase II subunit A C-terminal domain phosphatase
LSYSWLLKERKLSLIVDLDQTVVHATVDPTVGEWINEGRTWEAEQTSLEADSNGASKTKKRKKPPNPNWPAMKDVASFKLTPETIGLTPGSRGKAALPGEGSTYYIKPR